MMAKVSKHPRKTGAITVKKDGKIVGNIGRGKTNVPISNETISSSRTQKTVDTNSLIAQKAEKFAMLQKVNIVGGETPKKVDIDHISTLWEITEGQPLEVRMNMLANLMSEENKQVVYDFYSQKIDPHTSKLGVYENYGDLETLVWETDDPQLLDLLSTSSSEFVWRAVLQNENTSVETFNNLSQDRDLKKRCRIAEQSDIPPEISILLATDKSIKVRLSVASNTATPSKVLEFLANDKSFKVCRNVAYNKNTSPSTLTTLAKHSDWRVRICVASNPNTSTETLTTIVKEEEAYAIRSRAERTLEKRESNKT